VSAVTVSAAARRSLCRVNITARDVEYISRRSVGLLCLLAGVVGSAWMLVATAAPGALDTASFYAPRTFLMVVFALLFIGLLEAGREGLAGSDRWTITLFAPSRPALSLALELALLLPFYLVVLAGAVWTAQALATRGLSPTPSTTVLAVCLLVYGALRIPFALGWRGVPGLATALGLRRDRFEPVELQATSGVRTVIGFAIGILALDSLIVLVNAVVAPGDRTFYPYVSSVTPLAALLWMVGLLAISVVLADVVRGLRPTGVSILAACGAAPALLLDASVPLYPMIAGIISSSSR